MSKERFYIHSRLDRAWHMVHALGVVVLILSGFNIHFAGSFNILGSMDRAVRIHNVVGLAVSLDWAIWFMYNLFSTRIQFFVPGKDELPKGVFRQAAYYIQGIFTGEKSPYPTSPTRKFNPLQKWTYFGIMFGLVPFQITTGLYMLWAVTFVKELGPHMMFILSVTHTIVAFLTTSFVVGHIYLATTGKKPSSHFKQMLTGWHEPE